MTNEKITDFGYGIKRAWIDDDQIAIISSDGDMSKAATDIWFNVVVDTLETWTPGKKFMVVHDLSSRNQGLTPYARQRAEETYHYIPPDMHGHVAIVVRDGVINRLISLFFVRKRKAANIEERMFTTREAALKWLRELIKQEEPFAV